MPSLTAWLINTMGFRSDTRQMPIAQLGCAAGGAAINRAHDFCAAYPDSNVLIVSCELCSLCYQPDDDDVGSLLSDGLFGDAVAAAVVRGSGGVGVAAGAQRLVPHSEHRGLDLLRRARHRLPLPAGPPGARDDGAARPGAARPRRGQRLGRRASSTSTSFTPAARGSWTT